MYPADQPNPGYGTGPSRPSPMTPSANPPSNPGPGASRYIIIVCVVLALIIAGVVAWVVIRPKHDPQETPSAPTTSESAPESTNTIDASASVWTEPTITTFDLLDGLKEPDAVHTLGVWSGVAVFSFTYLHPDDTEQSNLDAPIIRAVDVATGDILWTYDTYPDMGLLPVLDPVSFFFDVDDVDLALAFPIHDPAVETDDPGSGGTQVMIRSLRTGDVKATHFIDPEMKKNSAGDSAWWYWGITTFQDGVLVLGGNTVGITPYQEETRAYSINDLDTPLWTVSGSGTGSEGWLSPIMSARDLPGGYVFTASGEYIGLKDGKPSGMKSSTDGDTRHVTFTSTGDVILQATYMDKSTNPDNDLAIPLASVSKWDPSTNTAKWTYELPPELRDPSLRMCTVHDSLLFLKYTDDPQSVDVYGVNLDSGKQVWKTSLTDFHSGLLCSEIWREDLPVVALTRAVNQGDSDGTVLLDMGTGDTVGILNVDSLFAMQNGLIGTVKVHMDENPTSETLSVIDLNAPDGPPVWSRDVSFVSQSDIEIWVPFTTPDGSMFVVQENGQYEFITM